MSKFLHNDDAKAIAILLVFTENSQAKNRQTDGLILVCPQNNIPFSIKTGLTFKNTPKSYLQVGHDGP